MADSIYVVGFPTIDGVKQEYATIVEHFDLKEMGLAWKPWGDGHIALVEAIDKAMMDS
jgi:polar amino acid transport system ATP-binding protein